MMIQSDEIIFFRGGRYTTNDIWLHVDDTIFSQRWRSPGLRTATLVQRGAGSGHIAGHAGGDGGPVGGGGKVGGK